MRGGRSLNFTAGKSSRRQALVLIGTAAEHHLVSLFPAHLHAHQANVANVVLGAGVGAAGYVQIHRLKNLECAVQHVGQRYCVRLGVAGGKAAALISGAGDGSAQHGAGIEAQAGGENICLGRLEMFAGDMRESPGFATR